MPNAKPKNGVFDMFLRVTQGIIMAVILALAGFCWGMNERMTAVEVRVQALIDRKIPPEWFEERVDRLELKIDNLAEAVHAHLQETH